MAVAENYLVSCWNCLGEFDALSAVWCSDDPKNPTKLCPFCFRCFCDASAKYKQEFWKHAPGRLVDEVQTLAKSKDRLGDILIRMRKLTTPQLLDVLVEQKKTGRRLGELLVERGLVKPDDITAALSTLGVNPLVDTRGVAYASSPVWDQSGPDAIIQYVLSLAARKEASDVHIEPKDDHVSVRYRIDGFFYRVDPIPKSFQPALTRKLFETFRLDPGKEGRPQTNRTVGHFGEHEYDLVASTLPTPLGTSATIKLVNRATFIKDFTSLGMELEDRVRLMEELRENFGLVLVTSPVFHGAITTAYSIMSFLVQGQRDVLSLESPIHWPMDGARQVEVEQGRNGLQMEETLRSVIAVRPDVVMLSTIPDHATALLAAQLSTSLLLVANHPAPSAVQGLASLIEQGVPSQLLATTLGAVTGQRLVRVICRICCQPAEAPAMQTLLAHGISEEDAATLRYFKGRGCPTCNTVGYRGRRAVFEVLPGTPEVRHAIEEGLPPAELEAIGVIGGMKTMRERCLDLIRNGITTFDEFSRLRL
jgi:type II secretory ATPase GspE/PulE/Tfp pilus assembly ATPase PilB-like protein